MLEFIQENQRIFKGVYLIIFIIICYAIYKKSEWVYEDEKPTKLQITLIVIWMVGTCSGVIILMTLVLGTDMLSEGWDEIVFFISEFSWWKQLLIFMSLIMTYYTILVVRKINKLENESKIIKEKVKEKVKEMDVINFKKGLEEVVKENIDELVIEKFERVKKEYLKLMGDEHKELMITTYRFIESLEKEKRDEFINTKLPKTKHHFMKMFTDLDNNEKT